jgi:hypothetical protein
MEKQKIHPASLLKATPVAALASAAINSILYFIGDASGIMDPSVGIPSETGTQPITLTPVIISSIFPVLVAAGVLLLINRFSERPLRIFGIVSIILLILSFANPFVAIPGMPLGMGLWLNVMHVVVAGAVWYVFSRQTAK